jgi:hypothetical protein
MDSNQIMTIRLANGEEISFVDWSDQPLFSTIEILSGSSVQEMTFFQYVAGDQVPAYAPVAVTNQRTSTENDTNLSNPGSMASTEEMLIWAIRPEIYRFNVEDAAEPDFAAPVALTPANNPQPTPNMLAVMNARLKLSHEISQKVYAEAGLAYFNWGAGLYTMQVDAAMATSGMPGQTSVRSQAIPMHMGGMEKFRSYFTFIDDGTDNGVELGLLTESAQEVDVDDTRFARVRLYLDGLHKRPAS